MNRSAARAPPRDSGSSNQRHPRPPTHPSAFANRCSTESASPAAQSLLAATKPWLPQALHPSSADKSRITANKLQYHSPESAERSDEVSPAYQSIAGNTTPASTLNPVPVVSVPIRKSPVRYDPPRETA